MNFNLSSFGIRFLVSVLLVFATYNPEGYSYFDWIKNEFPSFSLEQALVGIILIIGWVIFLRATLRSLGFAGLMLLIVFFGLIVAILIKWEWINMDAYKMVAYIVQALFAVILAVGMSWSHVRRRMSGQMDMDDVDDD